VSYAIIATALGVSVNTVKTHLRRLRHGHPELYAQLMAHRHPEFEAYHAAVAEARCERSRHRGRRRSAVRYRAEKGNWLWDTYRLDVTHNR
jgi:transposase